jgi:NTP pyrophosphatase (non-canonical NTP hydrolase)
MEKTVLLEKIRSILQRPDDSIREALAGLIDEADEHPSMMDSVIRSHVAVCSAKGMHEKAAYGQDPALYYSAAVSAEAGECLNKIIKGLRNGNNPEVSKAAVISELPDIFIYGFVLAHVLDLDIVKLVNEKVDVVIQRALDGYYGGKLPEKT